MRPLLVLSVIVSLTPVVAVAAPDIIEDLWPWSQLDTDEIATEAVSETIAPSPSTEATSAPLEAQACIPPRCAPGNDPNKRPSDEDPATTTTARGAADTITDSTTPGTTEGEGTPTTTKTEAASPSTTQPSNTTTTKPSPPTTRAPATTTTTTEDITRTNPVDADGTISGKACPCTVTGTVQLEGDIDLRGDLLVDGGTLVARPGVEVDGNGHQIMFMNGGKADFQGTRVFTWSDDGAKVNLNRDIEFHDLRRIIFHKGAGKSVLMYFSVTDSGGPSLGEYPIHFHLNGNSTRGTIVEGVVVHNSPNRAFVPHGSHGITFRHTIAKNIHGTAYWWDPPGTNGASVDNSNDILYDHALAMDVYKNHGTSGYHRVAAFELGRGSGNVIRNSVALNTRGGKDCSGFHWPENREGVWGFFDNAALGGSCNGIFVWQNTHSDHVINGFRGNGIENGAYRNQYNYFDIDVETVETHAVGKPGQPIVFDGGSIGKVLIPSHQKEGDPVYFRNLNIGSFVINNGAGGNTPGTYVLDNTNLSCDDIVYENVVAGTRVIIEDSEC